MNTTEVFVPSVADELAYAQLGDERRTLRLQIMAERWSAAPDKSVLQSSKSSAQAEAAYRFLNNPGFTYIPIVESHVEQTYERIAQEATVIVAHDTTEVEYQGEVVRDGLSRIKGRDQGFLAHFALALTADGSRRPLGVAAFVPWVRPAHKTSKKDGKNRSGHDYARDDSRESVRWWQTVEEVSLRARGASLIHVMDREADAYPLLAQLKEGNHRFVIRLCKDRVVRHEDGEQESPGLLFETLSKVDGTFELDVPLSRRAKSPIPQKRKGLGPREERQAHLEVASDSIQFKRPRYLSVEPEWLAVNVVHVRELNTPEGAEPVEWLLATSEPISTEAELRSVIGQYRTRWVIEEYFKALKTGCAIEKRQHESYETLLKMVAICIPIAWRLLLLRTLARAAPDRPGTAALTPTQVDVLRACSAMKLPENPTVRQCFEAVALFGGHHKSNGAPGWQVLGRGMEYLLALEHGWNCRAAIRDR
jgi:Transposase DNA-binding/Transposase DDE domain